MSHGTAKAGEISVTPTAAVIPTGGIPGSTQSSRCQYSDKPFCPTLLHTQCDSEGEVAFEQLRGFFGWMAKIEFVLFGNGEVEIETQCAIKEFPPLPCGCFQPLIEQKIYRYQDQQQRCQHGCALGEENNESEYLAGEEGDGTAWSR